jgi:hypothetical protein
VKKLKLNLQILNILKLFGGQATDLRGRENQYEKWEGVHMRVNKVSIRDIEVPIKNGTVRRLNFGDKMSVEVELNGV